MAIDGMEGMSGEDLQRELASGAKFVVFEYCVSLLVMTFRRSSDIHFVRAGEGTLAKSLPYSMLSMVLGWWGFPWGFIYTPAVLYTNFSGGRDVTAEVLGNIRDS